MRGLFACFLVIAHTCVIVNGRVNADIVARSALRDEAPPDMAGCVLLCCACNDTGRQYACVRATPDEYRLVKIRVIRGRKECDKNLADSAIVVGQYYTTHEPNLVVFFVHKTTDVAWVISAREMIRQEKRSYGKRKKA